jgi:AAA+ ATPase superfamily predicted ATPase
LNYAKLEVVVYKAGFVARSRELEVLDNLWQSPKATLLILYGRRRVGKTRLLTHWLQLHENPGLYWVAEPASALTQLRSFSQALMSYMDPEANVPTDFSFASWELALRQAAMHAKQKRMALFIDEVTYLIDVNPDFVGTLQKIWDSWLSDSNVMLALSGSQMGLMQRHLLDYDAPLYGRATAQMQLPPLPYGAIREYFPDYSITDRLAIYTMWGGVPAYWERIDPHKSVMENLRQNVLPAHAWMVDESRILLQDFINDLHNYVGILRAIADDRQTISEISQRTGLSGSKASFYLSVLRDTGFVERRVPMTQLGTDSRRGRYFVTDPYLRFFYRFMSAHQSKLALGQLQEILGLIEEQLPGFIHNTIWTELCREWLMRASASGELPLRITDVGSEWTASAIVQIVGLNDRENNIILGDCHWTEKATGVKVLEELFKKTPLVTSSREGDWTVYYVLFSANGWTKEARQEATRINAAQTAGRGKKKWPTIGLRLLDLAEVDADLTRWSV